MLMQEKDLGSQFFLRQKDIGKNRAKAAAPRVQLLNPRVAVHTVTDPIDTLSDTFFDDFDLICLVDQDPDTISKVDAIARSKALPFWSTGIMGIFGYLFCDLQEYTFTVAQHKPGNPEPHQTEANLSFCSFVDVLNTKFDHFKNDRRWKRKVHPLFFAIRVIWAFWSQHGRYPDMHAAEDVQLLKSAKIETMDAVECDAAFLEDELLEKVTMMLHKEIPPTCAVLGGLVAQELIKVLSRKEVPTNNFLLYDSWSASAQVMQVGVAAAV
eukprot:jgi/Hompol1/5261/HPOL_001883-RA